MAAAARAKLVAARMATPTVRHLSFELQDPFSFKPGQWVDCFIPQTTVVGGYSPVSSPLELPRLDLAVKMSPHPPARAAVTQSEPGDVWGVRAGGTFTLQDSHAALRFLFVAGGIGITPVMSMLRHLQLREGAFPQAQLLYSASEADELAFNAELSALSASEDRFVYEPRVTRGPGATGRVGAADLESAVARGVDVAFLCGPRAMATQAARTLGELGLGKDRVKFEAWW